MRGTLSGDAAIDAGIDWDTKVIDWQGQVLEVGSKTTQADREGTPRPQGAVTDIGTLER
jgi:hypothetical protein